MYSRGLLYSTIISLIFPNIVFASDNSKLAEQVSKQVLEVINAWGLIALGLMVLGIVAGAGIIITGAGNPKMLQSGKLTVFICGISITLLLSIYVIIRLVMSLTGLS